MATYDDGDIPFGSHAVTISSKVWIFESGSANQGSTVIESNDENSEPRGERIVPGRWTGSGTLQFPDADTAPPAIGATFTADLDQDGTDETWKISEVGVTFGAGDERKVPVTIRKRINEPETP